VICRHCGFNVSLQLIDLGSAPPSNALVVETDDSYEPAYPLRVLVCEKCWLVQTEDFAAADDLFTPDYAYLSGYSSTWVDHCKEYVESAVADLSLSASDRVIEVGTNDGTLLSFFAEAGMTCLGIEPTAATADVARSKGLDVVDEFLNLEVATHIVEQWGPAELVIANNVLAHVPDINGFSRACKTLLAPDGVATFEFQHLLSLIKQGQFDTIYHEHFSYLSLGATISVLSSAGLEVFDVEELPTHGGSLRVHAKRDSSDAHDQMQSVEAMLTLEGDEGMWDPGFYLSFQAVAERCREGLNDFLVNSKQSGDLVVGYGAAAKGNTLLNFAKVDQGLLAYVVDRNPAKQGMLLPGSKIPVVSEERLRKDQPDAVVVLPWNLAPEIQAQLGYVADWSGRLLVAVPELREL